MEKFVKSAAFFWLGFALATAAIIIFFPSPAHALGGNGNRLTYEERAVVYQQIQLEAASAQAKATIAEAKAFCAELGSTLDPRQVRFQAESKVRNVIRSRGYRNGGRNTIHLDLNRVIFGQARPSGDYTNTSGLGVTIGNRPCLMPKL